MPTDQTLEVEQELDNGNNIAEITVDMRETQETKFMENFLVIHQSTMVGMIVVMAILGVVGITLYACGVCWCKLIHHMCGGSRQSHNEEMEMAEQGEMPSKKEPVVTMIK